MQTETISQALTNSNWKRYTFLAGVTLICLCIGRHANRVRTQQDAIEAIGKFGGRVHYDYQCNDEGARLPRPPLRSPRNPLHRIVGDDWFNSAVNVQMPHLEEPSIRREARNAPAEVISHISRLTGLKTVRLSFSDVSNEDLNQLSQLKQLRSLALQSTKVRGGSLDGLSGLSLEFLSLERTRFDDEGLESLRHMKTLQFLNLTRTKVSDAGLVHLEQLPKLRTLILKRTLVTRSGYEAFKQKHSRCMVSWAPPEIAVGCSAVWDGDVVGT